MLNRKASNYIFYVILIGIFALIYLLRTVMVGGLIERTDALDNNNVLLQAQINALEDVVQANKDVQESHLFELYQQVPQKYSPTELTYLTIAKLELAFIDESIGYDRSITLNPYVVLDEGSALKDAAEPFKVVEVQVRFATSNVQQISDLVDILNESNQVFVVNYIDFYVPEDEYDYIEVNIHFLTFFEK